MCVTQESTSAPTLEALSSGIAIPIRNLHNGNNALMSTLPGAGAEEGAACTEENNVNNTAHEVRESGEAGEGEGGEGEGVDGEGGDGEGGDEEDGDGGGLHSRTTAPGGSSSDRASTTKGTKFCSPKRKKLSS